jgi:hypothetical protein
VPAHAKGPISRRDGKLMRSVGRSGGVKLELGGNVLERVQARQTRNPVNGLIVRSPWVEIPPVRVDDSWLPRLIG